jgi:hypothetical protein
MIPLIQDEIEMKKFMIKTYQEMFQHSKMTSQKLSGWSFQKWKLHFVLLPNERCFISFFKADHVNG